jgi:hypothetical protein
VHDRLRPGLIDLGVAIIALDSMLVLKPYNLSLKKNRFAEKEMKS